MDAIQNIKDFIELKPSPEQFQKVISALRGPDFVVPNQEGYLPKGGLERLKYLTTGRIRAIVAPNYFGDRTMQPLCGHEQIERDEWLDYVPKHFKSHYKEAVDAIKHVYKWDLKNEKAWSFEEEQAKAKIKKDNGGSITPPGFWKPLPLCINNEGN